MSLALTIALSLAGTYSKADDIVAGSGALNVGQTASYSDTSASSPADVLLEQTSTVPATQTITINLSQVTDFWGLTFLLSAVKAIYVLADEDNTTNLIVGGGAWTAPFVNSADTLAIRPGQLAALMCSDQEGWPVSLGVDTLLFTSSANALFTLIIVGVSENDLDLDNGNTGALLP